MENTKRVTKKEYFGMVREIVEASGVDNKEDILAFVDREVELLNKRKNGETKAQKENAELVEVVYNKLIEMARPVTATEIFNELRDNEAITSNQKVSALLKKLTDPADGRVIKTADKKKSYFSIAK